MDTHTHTRQVMSQCGKPPTDFNTNTQHEVIRFKPVHPNLLHSALALSSRQQNQTAHLICLFNPIQQSESVPVTVNIFGVTVARAHKENEAGQLLPISSEDCDGWHKCVFW